MRLIDADEMLKRLESWNTDDEMDKALYNFTLSRIIEQPTVETIPIEWIEFYISEIEDNVPDVALAFKELIEIWNEEHLIEQWKKKQEKQNGD